ncbi:MAG: penicillin acylase family protein [Caulobacteraceae bacterium]
MAAWADGLNFYLATHPKVHPRAIKRFEPWMALSFTEGSIGGDIERGEPEGAGGLLRQEPVGGGRLPARPRPSRPRLQGADRLQRHRHSAEPDHRRHALLLINPHTSFYFRSELQMTSDEGLNAYGASTWGQFFIYQGFNAKAGWMHTSSAVDAVDEFVETIVRKDGKLFYKYGEALRPVRVSKETIRYKAADGTLASRTFTVFHTHHGPIVKGEGDRWTAMALMVKPVPALEQSFLRTKQHDLKSYMKVAALKANSSNNTLFADTAGEIAYLHPQFIPRRDDRFDYTKPVDGADPATDWKGLHDLDTVPRAVSPPNGWVYNVNNWPYTAAGPYSPKKDDFPRYMDTAGESYRGKHALLLLNSAKDLTLDRLLGLAFDPYLPAFGELLPTLADAWDQTPDSDPLKASTKDQVAALKAWDRKWGANSTETSLAVFWGETLYGAVVAEARARGINAYDYMQKTATPAQKLKALADALGPPHGRLRKLEDALGPDQTASSA